MFATYRVKVEQIILKEKHVFRWHQFQSLDGSSIRIKGAKTGRIFCSHYSNKCLRLASEKFVLAGESNLSLATGLASLKGSPEPCSEQGISFLLRTHPVTLAGLKP